MRITDITPAGGYTFTYASIRVEMIDSHGTVRASKTLGKTWGVPPGYTTMFEAGAGASIRFRMSPSVPTIGCCSLMSFKADLLWG